MEQHWSELALRRFVGVVFAELHHQFVLSSFPGRLLLAWDPAVPLEEVAGLLTRLLHRLGDESIGMLLPPVLSLLNESFLRDVHH